MFSNKKSRFEFIISLFGNQAQLADELGVSQNYISKQKLRTQEIQQAFSSRLRERGINPNWIDHGINDLWIDQESEQFFNKLLTEQGKFDVYQKFNSDLKSLSDHGEQKAQEINAPGSGSFVELDLFKFIGFCQSYFKQKEAANAFFGFDIGDPEQYTSKGWINLLLIDKLLEINQNIKDFIKPS